MNEDDAYAYMYKREGKGLKVETWGRNKKV